MKPILHQWLAVIAIFFINFGFSACQKDSEDNTPLPPQTDSIPHLLKIIDWESVNANKDTVPEFNVQYAGDKITSLTGKYGEYITLQYDQNPGGI